MKKIKLTCKCGAEIEIPDKPYWEDKYGQFYRGICTVCNFDYRVALRYNGHLYQPKPKTIVITTENLLSSKR